MAALNVGVFLPTMTTRDRSPGDVVAAARHAEDLGFESVWAVDQLIAGTGVPFLESTTVLSAAAAATRRVRLGFGVLILPLRPVVWAAKQVATLQHVSGDRVILGVGIGGDRHDASWAATGVPRRERGRRLEAALSVLPDLIAGAPVRLPDQPATANPVQPTQPVQLSPGATVPPILVGGFSDVAVRRAARLDGWFLLGGSPDQVATDKSRLATAVAALDSTDRATPTPTGRTRRGHAPGITASLMVALHGDPALPDRAGLVRSLTDPDGMFGVPPAAAETAAFNDDVSALAAYLTTVADIGIDRVVVTVAAGDWYRQTELVAEAAAKVHGD